MQLTFQQNISRLTFLELLGVCSLHSLYRIIMISESGIDIQTVQKYFIEKGMDYSNKNYIYFFKENIIN